jgi:hypothetical protein
VRVEAGDIVFRLRRVDSTVEAIRISPMVFPSFPPVAVRAARAAAKQTGCPPVWVFGDPSVMIVGVACPGEKVPKVPKKRPILICSLAGAHVSKATGYGSGMLDCAPG